MNAVAAADLTTWLSVQTGDAPDVTDEVFRALYAELRRLARSHMRRETAAHTLSATGLLHEAWFSLSSQRNPQWQNRSHFLATASTMMRRILVNHAVARRAGKRAGERAGERVSLTLVEAELGVVQPADAVEVHEALLAFETVDPRAARMVELRFFGGLSNDEIADVQGVSLATVKRDWDLARAWLHRELATERGQAPG